MANDFKFGNVHILDVHFHGVLFLDAHISDRLRIDDLSVEVPDFVPLHNYDCSGGALCNDEFFQAFDGKAPSQDASNGRHSRIVPVFER